MGHFKIALSEVTFVRSSLAPRFLQLFVHTVHQDAIYICCNYIISFLSGTFSKARVGGQPLPSSSAKKPQVVSNFLHFEVLKPVKHLIEVCQVHIRVDRIEFVPAQHSACCFEQNLLVDIAGEFRWIIIGHISFAKAYQWIFGIACAKLLQIEKCNSCPNRSKSQEYFYCQSSCQGRI